MQEVRTAMTLHPDAVAARRQASTWEDAIRVVGSLFEDQGIASGEYAEAMIAAVHKFGPYMVLAPGIAMPHAATASGVNRGGLVVATLATPVEFGSPANDPVDVLVSFAAKNKEAHMARIKELAKALGDQELLAAARAATTDAELAHVFAD